MTKWVKKLKAKLKTARKHHLISKYREFDSYEPDIVIHKASDTFIEQKLPSEPPEGINYHFCATGYLTRNRNSDYCVIYTEWRNINNYCHCTLSELPLIYLALSSNAKYIVIPDALLNLKQPFQVRWWEVLNQEFHDKNIIRLSKFNKGVKGVIPVNHDTSSSKKMIGKCEYDKYHHSRATPYCLAIYSTLKERLLINYFKKFSRIYINRKTRRLKNEEQVQKYLTNRDFQVLKLEEYSLDQQVTLFSHAELIVGFHGAGLANLVFSNEKTCVVEIVDSDCVYPCYKDGVVIPGRKATRTYFHMISHMKNINYHCIESKDYFLSIDLLDKKMFELGIHLSL